MPWRRNAAASSGSSSGGKSSYRAGTAEKVRQAVNCPANRGRVCRASRICSKFIGALPQPCLRTYVRRCGNGILLRVCGGKCTGILSSSRRQPAASSALPRLTTCSYHIVMKQVRIAELKAKLSEYLRDVRRGETIAVLDRETPVAQIVPV